MAHSPTDTLRLLMPQWQGGNNPSYSLGAKLLSWLAPKSNSPMIEVPIAPDNGDSLQVEDGIVGRSILLKQLKAAEGIIDTYQPKKIITFGGDCLVSQAPFDYLNGLYGDDLGILWIDTHPDITTPNEFQHAHAMVLGNLLGEGDPELAGYVKHPINPKNVIFAGLQKTTAQETEVINRLGLRYRGSKELENNSDLITDWIRKNNFKYLAIHLDLDVLDPLFFRSVLFADPNASKEAFTGISMGKMGVNVLHRILNDVALEAEMVGLTIAEYLPWDAIALKNMLGTIPILNK